MLLNTSRQKQDKFSSVSGHTRGPEALLAANDVTLERCCIMTKKKMECFDMKLDDEAKTCGQRDVKVIQMNFRILYCR